MHVGGRRGDDRHRGATGAFAAHRAPAITARFSLLARPFAPCKKLTTTACFFADRRQLIVVAGPQEHRLEVDRALAYGLAWSGDRDLVLALPDGLTKPTLQRAAFLDAGIRVLSYGSLDELTELAIPTELEVTSSYTDPLQLAVHDLDDRASWVAILATWADDHPHLRTAHRPSYLAWHCLGRMVLKVHRIKTGSRASAGVHAGDPASGYAPLVSFDLVATISADQLHQLRAAAEQAITDRLSGKDTGHQEQNGRVWWRVWRHAR